jgi:peptidyl-tRNA hydrolase
MKPTQYIFINRGANMSAAKMAAQASHASILSYIWSAESLPGLAKEWLNSGHYTKIILLAEDEQQLDNINDYLIERSFKTFMVIDEGRTEVRPFTKTALGVQLVDKDEVQDIFGEFKVYKDLPKPRINALEAYVKVDANNHLNWRGKKACHDMVEIKK